MRLRVIALSLASLLTISFAALALVPVAAVTFFRARPLYAAAAARVARLVLRFWGIRVVVHQDRPFPRTQTIYVSNHSSTLDLFVLVALALPNTRFFLSGFLRKYVPLGIIAYLMGTFFTVPQSQPAARVRIFQRADRVLRRTGESVYLSPEGRRVATGEIGHFNKGAFHLATSLKAPMVPLYFQIPRNIDPGLGFDARPGEVHVHVMPAIDTSGWRIEELHENKERVRNMFVHWHRFGVHHVEPAGATGIPATAVAS
jgi:1-acyl-sn-glycerol-3-phosphate acyltransferase